MNEVLNVDPDERWSKVGITGEADARPADGGLDQSQSLTPGSTASLATIAIARTSSLFSSD
jgi:hypothetical protein